MKRFLALLFSLLLLSVSGQNPGGNFSKLEIPFSGITYHLGYSLSYNEEHEQAGWVAYELTAEETRPKVKRKNKFRDDHAIPTGSASDADYKNSGYDRGHLAPCADMCWSQQAMEESFFYSNMSPQDGGFNSGIWSKLEDLVRRWAVQEGAVYVVTGPVLKEGLKKIGPNGVSVPEYFYKVVLDYREPEFKGIGFILPNRKAPKGAKLQDYVVSIDSVEVVTGIDFFPMLPDDIETAVENVADIKKWNW